MLKLTFIGVFAIIGLITVQDNTMLKQGSYITSAQMRLITVQDNTMLKLGE